jgi:DNA polymerase/3'-5' exonuclease PolX
MSIMQLTQTIHILPASPISRNKHIDQPALPGMEVEQDVQPVVTNRQIAEALSSVADMLAMQNSNPYRVQAYRNAARGILELPEPAAELIARGEFLPVPGLGTRLRDRITELVETGSMTIYSDLFMQSLPIGVRRLMALDHIGPRTAIRLYEELGIDTPEKLWWASSRQRIQQLPGFGPRSEELLKEAAARVRKGREAASLSDVA